MLDEKHNCAATKYIENQRYIQMKNIFMVILTGNMFYHKNPQQEEV